MKVVDLPGAKKRDTRKPVGQFLAELCAKPPLSEVQEGNFILIIEEDSEGSIPTVVTNVVDAAEFVFLLERLKIQAITGFAEVIPGDA